MSNFSTIYDQLIDTTLPGITGFSSKTEIPNPYDLEANDRNYLRDGYGLIVGSSSETASQEFNFSRVDQELSVVLTEELRTSEHNPTPLQTVTKSLIEDAILVRVDFYNADQLTIDSNIFNIKFTGRTAIEVIGEGIPILTTTVNFIFEIRESI